MTASGLRLVFLLVALVLFLVAAALDLTQPSPPARVRAVQSAGLAAFAAAFLFP